MPCCTRLLRSPSCPFDHPRFRYVSDGQGAIERWPLASPRSRGSAPWSPGLSCTAFFTSDSFPAALARLGRSARLNAMCTNLQVAWRNADAFIPTLLAQHSFAASFPPAPRRLRVIWRRECNVHKALAAMMKIRVVRAPSVGLGCPRNAKAYPSQSFRRRSPAAGAIRAYAAPSLKDLTPCPTIDVTDQPRRIERCSKKT